MAWQEDYVEVDGLRLHYTRTGGDGPPVVLAHGFSDDGLCWTPVAEALAPEYDVVMIDARGHGRSDAPERGYGSAEQAADLAGAIAALGLRRPAVLGHSMGAATALVMAGTRPDLPGAILLEDPPQRWLGPDRAPVDPEWLERQRARLTAYQGKTREELIAEQRAAQPGWSEAELRPWADAKLRFNVNALNRSDAADIDWPATLRRITCPALLITAEPERGGLVTEEGAAALRELVPQLRVAHVPEAGHNIRRDQFDRYLAIVRDFLAETTGRS